MKGTMVDRWMTVDGKSAVNILGVGMDLSVLSWFRVFYVFS